MNIPPVFRELGRIINGFLYYTVCVLSILQEIELSEALSASNAWKSHYEEVVDEKTRLEVQFKTLKK